MSTASTAQLVQILPASPAVLHQGYSHVPVDPNLPFGGYKQSGVGRQHGRAMIDQYTELKSVCIPTPRA